ncbi:hypothetical protein L1049_024487 [Liquidambar formosana]|uniref:PGG domain-containing protein n=1 Tax=Liquidambar formosana TaxID=63359 RepID=A0AAP0X1A9_LIQFO
MELKRPITEISKSNTRTRSTLDLLLVATLVATVTFAAGFTMPGGLENSGRNQGMATLVAKHAFHAFLICNTISMYSSITAAVALIWAHLGDLNLVLAALNFSLPLPCLGLLGVLCRFVDLPWKRFGCLGGYGLLSIVPLGLAGVGEATETSYGLVCS